MIVLWEKLSVDLLESSGLAWVEQMGHSWDMILVVK